MAKKDNQNGVYKRPQRGWSPAVNKIVGIVFIVFVIACFVIRGFVGGNSKNSENNDNKSQITGSEENTADEVSEADGEYYTFRNESTLESHYEKHGSEFAYNNANEYQDGANAVISNPDSLHKTEAEDGDDVYYLESTNEFVVVSTDGYIRTYFKPSDGKDYYDRQ